MIKTITIRNIASYDDGGIEIGDLKNINFIYGSNGTGKTTISNFIANQTNSEYQNCNIAWQHSESVNCLVYNKDFREKSFSEGVIKGVFTLGQATKKDIETIKQKQLNLKEIQTEGIQKKDTLQKQEEKKEQLEINFREQVWKNVYKFYQPSFDEAFRGCKQKKSFTAKLLKEFEENNTTADSYADLREKSKTIFGQAPKQIPLIHTISFKRIVEIENDKIWQNKIIGKSDVNIAKIIQKLNINDWVNQGRVYLTDSDLCPFCQKNTITENFRTQLDEYFDESFVESTRKIELLQKEYIELTANISNSLSNIEAQQKESNSSKLNVENYTASLKTISSIFFSNNELLTKKIREPSRSITPITTADEFQYLTELLDTANAAIEKHNNIVKNYNVEKNSLIKSIWTFLSSEFSEQTTIYLQNRKGLKNGIQNLEKQVTDKRKQYQELSQEIIELSKNVTSIQPTIDEINLTLRKFGFLNFEIVPSTTERNHYQLQRENGELAKATLSEGEVTFITLLYFLQLAKGAVDKDAITDDRILVIDDPVSSLDSNVLFMVSTLIKKIINDIRAGEGIIKQIFLLTHNVYFHKEVSFINSRTKNCKNTNYWILRKNGKVTSIQSFKSENPISTSYELMWKELKEKDQNSGITIQNIMRRIIENYFKILGQYKDEDLIQKFSSQDEQKICKSLICWINDGSHSISDDLFIEEPGNTIDIYLKVFKDIFILTNHKGHYDMMMSEK